MLLTINVSVKLRVQRFFLLQKIISEIHISQNNYKYCTTQTHIVPIKELHEIADQRVRMTTGIDDNVKSLISHEMQRYAV